MGAETAEFARDDGTAATEVTSADWRPAARALTVVARTAVPRLVGLLRTSVTRTEALESELAQLRQQVAGGAIHCTPEAPRLGGNP